MKTLGYTKYTVSTTAVTAASQSPPAGANKCVIVADGADIMIRSDGTAPTASTGLPIYSGTPVVYDGSIYALQFIRKSADSTVYVEWLQ